MTKPGLKKGVRLRPRERRAIQAEVAAIEAETNSAAYTFRYDGKDLFKFTTSTRTKVDEHAGGREIGKSRRLTFGLSARVIAAASSGAVAVLTVVAERLI